MTQHDSSNDYGGHFRDAFLIDDSRVCYLDGNSLGRLPLAAQKRVATLVAKGWGTDLIGGWNADWIHLPRRIGAKIADLIGARPNETVVADSTSVNLFKLATAALRHQVGRRGIVTTAANFPSDLYALESASRASGEEHCIRSVGSAEDITTPSEMIAQAINEDTALVSLSHVEFRSGFLHDMRAVTEAAHDAGALVLWDLSHSVGAVPIALNDLNVDLAVGCTYKYLCGGPGAPAFLYVREDLHESLDNPVAGWFSHRHPFQFAADYVPADSVDRFLTGTPPILSLAAVEAGVDLVCEAGLEHLRARSEELTSLLVKSFDRELARLGFQLRTPRNARQRGSHVSIAHPEARRITLNLIERHRVIPDFRQPDNIRLGIAPLYTTENELNRSIEALVRTVQERQYEQVTIPDEPVT